MKCLVALLSLALINGNAHAALHLRAPHTEPCPEAHHHPVGKSAQHDHRSAADLACCCDCLGCASAVTLTREPAASPADFPSLVHYDIQSVLLTGRSLLPEPDPPRPITLI